MCQDQTVLVVDDDPACRDLHSIWLEGHYEVLTAADGETALDLVDEADVLLLDREMPGMNGTEVARRARERGGECFVVVVSGVEPDFDILDMPIDEYLVKPVSRETVLDAVRSMIDRSRCQDLHRRFYSLAARRATLELQKSATELAHSEEYEQLTRELEATRAAVEELLSDLDAEWKQTLSWALDEGETPAEGLPRL